MMSTARAPEVEGWNPAFRTRLSPPDIVGIIRSRPEDFVVTEQPGFEVTGKGEHVYLDVEKRNANTAWVAWQLAQRLGVAERDMGYAGRKDRHAVTRQWFSAYLPGSATPTVIEPIEGVTVHRVTRHRHKLRPGQLAANRFQIRVLLPAAETDTDIRDRLAPRLERVRQQGFPNYFGAQRFGRDGANLVLADRLLRCGEKIRGNRGMAISAARAYLFNSYLDGAIAGGRELAEETGPLIGKVRDPQPGEEALDEVMQAWVAGLRRLGAKADSRALQVTPADLDWQFTGQVMALAFSLPAGSYATSLLRELVILEDACQ